MRSSGIKVELTNDKCPQGRREGQKTPREGDVKAKAEDGVLCANAKEHQGFPPAPEASRKAPPSEPLVGTNTAYTLILAFPPPELC